MSSMSVLSVGALIYDVLSKDDELSRDCNKIFPVVSEDEAILPYIVYSRSSIGVIPIKYGEPMEGATTAYVEISCYSESYSQSQRMAERVCRLLDNSQHVYTDNENNQLVARSISLTGADEQWDSDAYVQHLSFQIKVN